MGRFPTVDKWIAGALLAVWVATFGVALSGTLGGAGIAAVYAAAAEDPDEYPVVAHYRPYVTRDPVLLPGDRLIRVGDMDLRGMGATGVFLRMAAASGGAPTVPVVYERDGVRREALHELAPIRGYNVGMLPASLALALCALFLLLRASPEPVLRLGVPTALLGALECSTISVGPLPWMTFLTATRVAAVALTGPLLLLSAMRFPRSRPIRSAWARWLPWLLLVRGPAALAAGYGWEPIPYAVAIPLILASAALMLGGVVAALGFNYLRSDPIGRRQMRWVLLSVIAGVAPLWYLTAFVVALDPSRMLLLFQAMGVLAVVPIGVVIGIVRYDLFDIDRLITATTSYNLLIVVGLGVLLTAVPWAAEALAGATGLGASSVQLATGVALAAALVPANRHLRPRLEQWMFRERHAIDAGLEQLRSDLTTSGSPKALFESLGQRLHELFRPESTVIYGPDGDDFAAIFVSGRGVVPTLEGDGPVLATVRRTRDTFAVDAPGAAREAGSHFERAALATLNAAVVVPIARSDGALGALLALGPKRSGDIYVRGELHGLSALADRAALELQHFDARELERQGQSMQEALRRYVPGAVADQVARGRELASEEREVTVLFVDIRGYTGLAEGRGAREVFSTINDYTERVSRCVREAGGSVVEFNGDGMMAVFGAPEPLADKERAAVRAARAVQAEVQSLTLDGAPIAVGVGIATGNAYVGNIQAADRLIWSAIGDTTNLAARLQSMTRELGASVIVDAFTHLELTRREATGFERFEQMSIRGRASGIDVYALPVAP